MVPCPAGFKSLSPKCDMVPVQFADGLRSALPREKGRGIVLLGGAETGRAVPPAAALRTRKDRARGCGAKLPAGEGDNESTDGEL